MAVNVGLKNLAKKNINKCSDLAPTRLEINDAIGESIRVYIRNIRFEFTINDYKIFAELFEQSLDNMDLFFPRSSSKGKLLSTDSFNFFKKMYKRVSFLEEFSLVRPLLLNFKRFTRNKLVNNVHGGMTELSRPFFKKIISQLNQNGRLIILRKFETLPFSFQGGDIDCFYDGPLDNIRDTFKKVFFSKTDQYCKDGIRLLHQHFYRFDQHYDFAFSLVINEKNYENITLLNEKLTANLNTTPEGFYTLDKSPLLLHLIDSVIVKYNDQAPHYYDRKIKLLFDSLNYDDLKLLDDLINLATNEHQAKIHNYIKRLRKS